MAPPIAGILDVLIEEIFLRLPDAEDLARASAACPSFRRIIADHAFLRHYRALHPPPLVAIIDSHKPFVQAQPPHPIADHAFLRHYRALHPPPLVAIIDSHKPFVQAQPPHPIANHAFLPRYRALHRTPLIGILDNNKPFVPAQPPQPSTQKPFGPTQPPHPSAVAARAFAGFDFSCPSFLPSTACRIWSPFDFFDGRALLAGVHVSNFSCRHILVAFTVCGKSLVRNLVVCEPVHGRYIMLPAIPVDLNALELLGLETFLAPGEDEEDPLSFRVICLVQCRMNLLLLVFSSLDGQWHVLTYDQWGALATLAPFVKSDPELSSRQFTHGCFYWHLHLRNELLVLDVRTMDFSAINLPSKQRESKSFVLVEAAKGMLGMLTEGNGYDKDSKDHRYWLAYSILANNQWHLEVIPLPVKRVRLVGVAGGYLLIYAMYVTSSEAKRKFGYFSVDLIT